MTNLRALLAAAAAFVALTVGTGPAAAATNAQDEAWLVAAHQGNLAEIAAGTTAVEQATSTNVRELGQMLVDDHTRLDADLTQVAGQLGITLPSAPTQEQQTNLAALEAIDGESFDKAWVEAQIRDHRTTLEAGERESTQGSDPSVTALAQAAEPVVQHHLDELLALAEEPDFQDMADPGGGSSLPYVAGIVLAIVLVLGVAYLTSRRRSQRRADAARGADRG
jgi:putative membrane protein